MDILKQKVDVLKKSNTKGYPQKVSETIEKLVKTGIDYLSNIWEKRKLLTEEGKKKVRKRFLDFNKKIANLWKKPEFAGKKTEFETKEIHFLPGKKYITKGVDGFFPHQFLREIKKTLKVNFAKIPAQKPVGSFL